MFPLFSIKVSKFTVNL